MPASRPFAITAGQARQFQLETLGLRQPHAGIDEALAHHGYIQIDPINVCGRMHEHILRNRVAGYRLGDLFTFLHGPPDAPQPLAVDDRRGFEHYLPRLGIHVAFPLEAYPYLRRTMRLRARRESAWSGQLDAPQRRMARHLFERLADGPVSSDDITAAAGSTRTNGWGRTGLAKSTLDKLFFHGRVLISRRRGQRRVFDLPERVLPAAVLNQPLPSLRDEQRWSVLTKLRQHRLCRLKRGELPAVRHDVQAVLVPELPTLHVLTSDLPLLQAIVDRPTGRPRRHAAALLAPLDPLIYDRALTAALWKFSYTWEVYTPPAKRVRGYYALPLLVGDALVGHVNAKADHARSRLIIESATTAQPVTPAITRSVTRALGKFLELLR